MVLALHHFLWAEYHIIAKVIEAEFIIGAVGDITFIGAATLGGVRTMLVNAVNGEEKKLENRPYPL